MNISLREFSSDNSPYRYLMTVDKLGGLSCEYIIVHC
jgi:hypothetical protein